MIHGHLFSGSQHTPFRGLTITMVINHWNKSWDDHPSTHITPLNRLRGETRTQPEPRSKSRGPNPEIHESSWLFNTLSLPVIPPEWMFGPPNTSWESLLGFQTPPQEVFGGFWKTRDRDPYIMVYYNGHIASIIHYIWLKTPRFFSLLNY